MTPKRTRSSVSPLARERSESGRRSSCLPVPSPMRSPRRNGGGHVERLELVEQPRAFRDRGAPYVQQRPQRRERTTAAWGRDVLADEHAPGGRERVDAVWLPHAALRPPRTLDLDDGVAGASEVLADTGAPAAGYLDAEHEPVQVPLALGPLLQLDIAGGRRRERELARHLAKRIECHGAVALLVGVDPDSCYSDLHWLQANS